MEKLRVVSLEHLFGLSGGFMWSTALGECYAQLQVAPKQMFLLVSSLPWAP